MFINNLFDIYNKLYSLFFYEDIDTRAVTNWNSKTLLTNPIEITYMYNEKKYTTPMHLPRLSKDQQITILSSELNHNDSDYIFTRAGPFHNFFMNPITVRDIIDCPDSDFKQLKVLVLMNNELLTFTYTDLSQQVLFHYGTIWGNYLVSERNQTEHKLEYLDLHY